MNGSLLLAAVRMIANVGIAWLSREILFVAIFGVLLAVTLFGMYRQAVSGWLLKLTALFGLLALFSFSLKQVRRGRRCTPHLISSCR